MVLARKLIAVAIGLLLLAVFGALAAGCATGPTRPPESGVVSEGTSPTNTPSGEPTPMPGGQKVPLTVFYSLETTGTREGQEVSGEKLVGVTRMVASGTWLIQDAAELWLDGPTAAERAKGLVLAAPPGQKIRSVKLEKGGIVAVDLPKTVVPRGGTAATMNILGQLVYTMTAQPGIKGVRIEVDGVRVTEFGGEGFDVSKPITRADVADYFLP